MIAVNRTIGKGFSKAVGERILVVDDDKGVSNFLMRHLSRDGYLPEAVRSGREAVKKVRRGGFALMLLDLRLPDIHGTEVLRRIRKSDILIAVIVITGYPGIDTAVETLKQDAFDYIQKPFDLQDLRFKIKGALKLASHQEKNSIIRLPNIGRKVRRLRLEAGLTLAKLAEKAKLTKGFISQLEAGKKFPRLDTINAIAKVLNVSAYLFFSDAKRINRTPRRTARIRLIKSSPKLLTR